MYPTLISGTVCLPANSDWRSLLLNTGVYRTRGSAWCRSSKCNGPGSCPWRRQSANQTEAISGSNIAFPISRWFTRKANSLRQKARERLAEMAELYLAIRVATNATQHRRRTAHPATLRLRSLFGRNWMMNEHRGRRAFTALYRPTASLQAPPNGVGPEPAIRRASGPVIGPRDGSVPFTAFHPQGAVTSPSQRFMSWSNASQLAWPRRSAK